MKVLYLCVTGNNIGGVEKQLVATIQHSSKYGMLPVGVLFPRGGLFETIVREMGIETGFVHYHGWSWRNPWRYFQTIIELLLWIRRLKPEIIVLTNHWLVEYAAAVRKLTGIPTVCQVVNVEPIGYLRTKSRYFDQMDCVIVSSQAAYKRLIEACPNQTKNTRLISNGIDITLFKRSNNRDIFLRQLSLPSQSILVGYVGRLIYDKGIEDLLLAWPMVRKEYSTAYLLIVGQDEEEGKYRARLEDLCMRQEIRDSVYWLGFRSDIPYIMSNIEVLVVPSHEEAFGLVTVEGMAAGCLVLATNVGGIPEVVVNGKTGLLIPAKSPRSIADGICYLLSLSEVRANEMRQAAYNRVKELYDFSIYMRGISDLYREMIDKSRRPR